MAVQSADQRAEVQGAVEAIRQARTTLERLRDVRVKVTGAWQQMDDLPDGAAEELRRRVAEVVTTWTADMHLLMKPAWQFKVDSHRPMDVNGLEMSLPVLWQEGGADAGSQ